jgi:phage tail-like protein
MYPSAGAARARVLSVLDAAGAVDLLMEWDEAYPAARVAPADVPPPMKSPTRVAVCGGIVYVWCAGANEVYVLDEAGRLVGREADVAGVFAAEDEPPGAGGGVAKAGSLLTTRLDSGVDRCVWHKVLMRLALPLPSGARVTVWTYSTNDAGVTTADVALLGPDEWRTGQSNAAECLVRSPPGRFLWLRLELTESGVASPLVEQLRVYFPRDGYLQYLPAVYQADPTSRDFLDRFLSIFETEFSRIEETVSGLSRLFNARGTPEPFLAWLGAWVGMVFQPSWPAVNRRELLRRSAELYRRRGTAGGLALFVELALGLNVRIVEGWRARQAVMLGGAAPLGSGSILLGDCAGDRLRLDVHSRVGEFRLNDVGDPRHDAVAAGAHEFTVYVDGPLSDLVERSLRQLIDQEKPAHASYALRQVSGRLRVGVEATVGVDTGVGPPPRATLGREASLGRDTVLACDPVAAAAPVIGSVEVG